LVFVLEQKDGLVPSFVVLIVLFGSRETECEPSSILGINTYDACFKQFMRDESLMGIAGDF
jgi:hypothetical protein